MLGLLLAPLALAAGPAVEAGGGHAATVIPWETLAFAAANLIIFLGLLIWFARRPVGDALRSRALAIRTSLDDAARLQEEAAARFSDVESRLVSLDRRVEEMKVEAAVEADREAERIRLRAEADAQRIRETAERTIREETQSARNQLRGEAARLAIQLARETLKRNITAEDQERLARDFLAAVKTEANHD